MNLRHAAALALVGWFLMAAHIERDGPFTKEDIKAPLKEWDTLATFDSKQTCESARTEYVAHPRPFLPTIDKAFQCVSEDDPRLKEK
jgi:hypothetical protein